MKNAMTILTLSMLGFSTVAMAQSAGELTCRAKAKEAAVTLYSNCMTEYQNTKMEEIRSNYKNDLQSLKEKYGSQLKELSGGAPAPIQEPMMKAAPAPTDANDNSARRVPTRSVRTAKAPNRSVSTPSASVQTGTSLSEKQAPVTTKVIPVETENAPIELQDNPI